jgi:hypothetical protein
MVLEPSVNYAAMTESIIDIILSPVVSSNWDVFWEELPEQVRANEAADTLVISTVYAAGSAEEQQLQKMLGACKLSPEQYRVVQLAEGQHMAWHRMRELLQPTKVLLLGINPAQLGISALFIAHEVNNFDTVQWMPTVALPQLLQDNNLKQHLWTNVFRKVYLG